MNAFETHVSDRLAPYLDGVLQADEHSSVERHVASCEECAAELELVRSGIAAMGALALMQAPEQVWTGIVMELDRRQRSTRWQWLAAAAAVLVCVGVGAWYWSQPKWDVVSARGHVSIGRWLETGSEGTAQFRIGAIGHVDVRPLTRLRTVASSASEHRLALAHGQIHAKITAPPRIFFVDTAAGTAIDLGCEYDLQCDRQGNGFLRVSQGWVLYSWRGEESLVPAGASCRTWPGRRPGTPAFDDATKAFLGAVESFDTEGRGLDTILAEARGRDSLTLWHLMSRAEPTERKRILERAMARTPLPAGIAPEALMKLDAEAMRRWREELAWTW